MARIPQEYPFQVYLNRYEVKKKFFFFETLGDLAFSNPIASFKEIKDARLFAKAKNTALKSKIIKAEVYVPDLKAVPGIYTKDLGVFQ